MHMDKNARFESVDNAHSPHRQFLHFGLVGVAGFFVDSGVITAAHTGLGLDLYSARMLSYLAAATSTWSLNRHFTFVYADRRGALRQWACFLVVNTGGGAVNYLTYALLVSFSPLAEQLPLLGPIIAIGVGSLAGMGTNFTASRRLVFRHRN